MFNGLWRMAFSTMYSNNDWIPLWKKAYIKAYIVYLHFLNHSF